MGSGLALAIKTKWPVVEIAYKEFFSNYPNDFNLLGKHQLVKVGDNLHVCNIFGQYEYGTYQRQTDYAALNIVFSELSVQMAKNPYCHYYFPFKFGCDRGGGDWKIVTRMLTYYLPTAIMCKLP